MINHARPVKAGVVALFAAAALAVSACSGSTSSNPGTSSGTASSATSVKAQLVVAIPGDIDNFDPDTNQLITYEYAIRNLVFSSLVKYDANLKLVPDLAQFSVNTAATVFTFKLNPKAVFQDGTPVNAAAVVQSLKRAAGSKGSIWAPRLAGVKSYATPDTGTVVITLNKPNADFLAGLTDIAILAPSSFTTTKSKPVGSGPYSFVSWTPNKQIVLQKFDKYFGTPGRAQQITEEPITDQQVALNDLYSGSVDIIASASTATTAQVDSSRATVVSPSTSNSMDLVEFNSSGKLADPRVRQALAYALDKSSVQKIAYNGKGTTTASPLPASSWAYSAQTGYPYNLAKAKSLLAAAGASKLSFTLDILDGYPQATAMARVWQQSLAQIGVTLTPKVEELSTWLDQYVSRKYDAIWNSFDVGGDPNSFFDVIMTPHLGDDYKNPQMTALMAKGIGTSVQSQRAPIYAQLQQLTVAQVPVMIVAWEPVASITATDVTGYQMNPQGWALFADAAVASK
ncbi:MAG TPA: ABC transporter substrate-binding protein [Trebonia sp.]